MFRGKFHYHMIILTGFLKTKIDHAGKQFAFHQLPHVLKTPTSYFAIMLRGIIQLQQPILEIKQTYVGRKESFGRQ